jgi:hypothetical protein
MHQFDEFVCLNPESGGAGSKSKDAHVGPTHPTSQTQVDEEDEHIPRRPQSSSVVQDQEATNRAEQLIRKQA